MVKNAHNILAQVKKFGQKIETLLQKYQNKKLGVKAKFFYLFFFENLTH